MLKIYTKTGDRGSTSLIGGSRVSKASMKVRAYGAVDTANAALGMARSHTGEETIRRLVKICQLNLFKIGAQVAQDENSQASFGGIQAKDVEFLEAVIDELNKELAPIDNFIVPGDSQASSFYHKARVDIRSAERELVGLMDLEEVDSNIMKYLNRLSDLAFVLSRYVDRKDQPRPGARDYGGLIEACMDQARKLGVAAAVAIVDRGGNLEAFQRMEDCLLASTDIAIAKAVTANGLRMPTEKFRELTRPGGDLYGLENSQFLLALGGGLPLYRGGELIGALGVSGGSVEEDLRIANAGADWFNSGEVLI